MKLKQTITAYFKDLVYQPVAAITTRNRISRLQHFLKFIGERDITVKDVNYRMLQHYHTWLKGRGYALNTYNKQVKEVKAFLRWCIREEIDINHSALEYRLPPSRCAPIKYLRPDHLDKLFNLLPLLQPGLEKVARLFLLQCYTGLAYADTQTFNSGQHIETIGGRMCISIMRKKTGTISTVPILPKAYKLLEYWEFEIPRISNQVYNKQLAQLSIKAGLPLRVTSHIGRKTAGMLFINNGVSLEAVQHALGHSRLEITQRYYAVLQKESLVKEFGYML